MSDRCATSVSSTRCCWPSGSRRRLATDPGSRRQHHAAVAFLKDLLETLDRSRLAEIVALHIGATFGNQMVELIGGLHAFGDDLDLERPRQIDDRTHDSDRVPAF